MAKIEAIGGLFSGLGALDLACEAAFGAVSKWQLDLVGAAVRRRHFPGAKQYTRDLLVRLRALEDAVIKSEDTGALIVEDVRDDVRVGVKVIDID